MAFPALAGLSVVHDAAAPTLTDPAGRFIEGSSLEKVGWGRGGEG